MSCPLCRERKGKRLCPAKGERICPACCGSKRRVDIDCPDDCAFLGGHAGAWEGRETERNRDRRRLAGALKRLGDRLGLHYLAAVGSLAALRRAHRDLHDRQAKEAVSVLVRTVETHAKGILYEHTSDDPPTQRIVDDLRRALGVDAVLGGERLQAAADGVLPTLQPRELAEVLLALADSLSETLREGGRSDFLDTADRVARELGTGPPSAPPAPRLIVEP